LPATPNEVDRRPYGIPDSALIGHVVAAVRAGLVRPGEPDRLLETAFPRASGRDLAQLYGEWVRADREQRRASPTPAQAEGARGVAWFWGWRLDDLERMGPGARRDREADGLGQFFLDDAVPDDVALASLRRTVLVAGRLGHVMSLWWAKLARLAEHQPDAVVDLTTLIIERHARDEFYRVRIADVSAIARVGLASGQIGVRRAAERLVHLLGERGYDDIGQLLGIPSERHA
jgi:hypothetical protein